MITVPIDIELILQTEDIPLKDSYLHYRSEDPFAVALDIANPGGQRVAWAVARELVADGAGRTVPLDLGDIDIWRTGDHKLCILLHSDEGTAVLRADADQVEDFLSLSYTLVPEGRELEHVDIGAELAAILGEAV